MALNLGEIRKIASRVVSETEPAPLHERKAVEKELISAITRDRRVMANNSEHDINSLVHHLLDPNQLPVTPARLEEWLATLKTRRDQTLEWHVLFGLENVRVITAVELGDVTFRPGGPDFEREYVEWLCALNEPAKHTDTPEFIRLVLRRLSAASYAVVKVETGGSGRAQEIARERCAEAIAVLRYFAQLSRISAPIGILGQPTDRGGGAIAVSSSVISTTLNPTGHGHELELDDETIGWMRYNCLERLNTILRKRSRSEIEDRVVAGLRWFGESLVDSNATDRFVKCIICLEALLGHKDPDQNITAPLAEKVAFLLHQGATVMERLSTYKQVKALYSRRSRIVHSGRFAGDGDDVIHQATDICEQLLGVFISSDILDRFQQWDDLSGWFDELRFSG